MLHAENGVPQMTMHAFGQGCGVYMSRFRVNAESTRMLLELLLHLGGVKPEQVYLSDHALVETAFYPATGTLVVANSAEEPADCTVHTPGGDMPFHLAPMETRILQL